MHGKIYTFHENYEINEDIIPVWRERQNIHPYLGFVSTPDDKNKNSISDFGFRDSKYPIQARSNEKIVIGIFGGSVACQVGRDGINALESELKKSIFFINEKIVFLNFGNGGYKQPQQLFILNYILALGGDFDIVIDLDGFNETALPVAENIPNHVFPFYPRSWHSTVSGNFFDYDNELIICKVVGYLETQKKLNRIFSSSPFRYSITANLFLKGLNRYMSNVISKLRQKLLKPEVISKMYVTTGPTRQYKNDEAMYQDLAMVWKNCSLQMNKICNANNIKYFHFLQPCQYVPNSKIMKKEELEIAFSKNQPYKKPIECGYPYLIKAGNELVKEGVNFNDLTMVFEHNDEILYCDNCCHFNKRGLTLLSQIIGEIITKNVKDN